MKVLATLVDDDGHLFVKCESAVELGIAALIIAQVVSVMGSTFGEEAAAAAKVLRSELSQGSAPDLPTVIIKAGGNT